jgi:hypothetical protein
LILPAIILRLFQRRRTRVEQIVHDRLVIQAKAAGIPLYPFTFERLAEIRARRAKGLPDTWLIDIPTGATHLEYARRLRNEWIQRGCPGAK